MFLFSKMTCYEEVRADLRARPRKWLVTGVAGFIGSNLLETLLGLDQRVVGLDNFSTGHRHNLDEVRRLISSSQWARFQFIEGDIRHIDDCIRACEGVDYVLHQAALGSVPRSVADPLAANAVNITGFLNMLVASRDGGVKSFTYASSSSVYGDHPGSPKVEDAVGEPLSPYAITKYANELYADVFARSYGFGTIGLRYFNVFGPRQDPNGSYAAVIPKWAAAILEGDVVYINGDGRTSRDFCYVDNAIQANILAAVAEDPAAVNEIYNVTVGEQTTLKELYAHLLNSLAVQSQPEAIKLVYRDFRVGDVRHSRADVGKARRLLGYSPTHTFQRGLAKTARWYRDRFAACEAP